MSQVSKRILSKNTEQKLYNTLWETFAKLKSQQEIQSFINDLLSPTEKTMLAKRLAIAVLLLKDYNYQDISNILKVSGTTIAKISLILSINKGYKTTIRKVALSESMKEFWQEMIRFSHRLRVTKDLYASNEYLKKKLDHTRKTLV